MRTVMNSTEVEYRLKKIIAEYTEVDVKSISHATSLREEIGLSSFDMISLIVEIEEQFSIDIDDLDAYAEIETFEEIIEYITNRVNASEYSKNI